MIDRSTEVEAALHNVWLRHRDRVIEDLDTLLTDLHAWNHDQPGTELADDIRTRAHRIRGSLSMVGRREGTDELRTIEEWAVRGDRPYAPEVVDRIHDLRNELVIID